MRILYGEVPPSNKHLKFKDLHSGDLFRYNTVVYLKLEDESDNGSNAVSLEYGRLALIYDDDDIECYRGDLVLSPNEFVAFHE